MVVACRVGTPQQQANRSPNIKEGTARGMFEIVLFAIVLDAF